MKNVKAEAALKIREAMSGLREAMKTASPADRRAIHACMSELRAIKADLDETPEVEPTMEIVEEDADSIDGDEELALSALELAAAALKAAAEEDGEEETTEEEPAEEEAEEKPAEEESAEEPAEEEAEEENGTDVDALTDEEIAALEAEGLLEGSAVFQRSARTPCDCRKPLSPKPKIQAHTSVEARLTRVQSRLNKLLAMDGEEKVVEEVLDEEPLDEGVDEALGGEDAAEMALLDEEDAELTPEEIAMLEEMGIGLEASALILASSNVLWAAKKRKKATKSQKAASAKKWKGAKIVGRSIAKRTKKGKFYVTVYRKKGNLTGSYNLFYKKKPVFKKLKAPSGASKAVAQRIAKHNAIAKAKVVKESPFAAKKASAKK
jgi:hypothetical protein